MIDLRFWKKKDADNAITQDTLDVSKKMLGMFELGGEIGRGAMGVVYSGRDPVSGREVAIKTMKLAGDFNVEVLGDAEERFLREAKILTWLDHPNIVTIYDVGHENGMAYIAMEFLKGVELSEHAVSGSLLPLGKVLDIMAKVADALDYAHEQDVVHRDVKPGNFMYDAATDMVKVTDFGISRLTNYSSTQVGMVLGSPLYMSPEQAMGGEIGGRSDIFSLGTSLYQMVSGSLPFKGDSGMDVMRCIVKEPHLDIKYIKPSLPAGVREVINRALAKKPEDRYQRGSEMAEDIRRCLAEI